MPARRSAVMSSALESRVRRIVDTVAGHTAGDHGLLDRSWADIGIDSLDMLELALRCEDEVGHAIPDAEVARWSSPRHVLLYLGRAASPA